MRGAWKASIITLQSLSHWAFCTHLTITLPEGPLLSTFPVVVQPMVYVLHPVVEVWQQRLPGIGTFVSLWHCGSPSVEELDRTGPWFSFGLRFPVLAGVRTLVCATVGCAPSFSVALSLLIQTVQAACETQPIKRNGIIPRIVIDEDTSRCPFSHFCEEPWCCHH